MDQSQSLVKAVKAEIQTLVDSTAKQESPLRLIIAEHNYAHRSSPEPQMPSNESTTMKCDVPLVVHDVEHCTKNFVCETCTLPSLSMPFSESAVKECDTPPIVVYTSIPETSVGNATEEKLCPPLSLATIEQSFTKDSASQSWSVSLSTASQSKSVATQFDTSSMSEAFATEEIRKDPLSPLDMPHENRTFVENCAPKPCAYQSPIMHYSNTSTLVHEMPANRSMATHCNGPLVVANTSTSRTLFGATVTKKIASPKGVIHKKRFMARRCTPRSLTLIRVSNRTVSVFKGFEPVKTFIIDNAAEVQPHSVLRIGGIVEALNENCALQLDPSSLNHFNNFAAKNYETPSVVTASSMGTFVDSAVADKSLPAMTMARGEQSFITNCVSQLHTVPLPLKQSGIDCEAPSAVVNSSADQSLSKECVPHFQLVPSPQLHSFSLPVMQPAPLPVMQPAPLPVVQPATLPVMQLVPSPQMQLVPSPQMQPLPSPLMQPLPSPQVQPLPSPLMQPLPSPQMQFLTSAALNYRVPSGLATSTGINQKFVPILPKVNNEQSVTKQCAPQLSLICSPRIQANKSATLGSEVPSIIMGVSAHETVASRAIKLEPPQSPDLASQERWFEWNCESESQPFSSLPKQAANSAELMSETPVSSTGLAPTRKTYTRQSAARGWPNSLTKNCALQLAPSPPIQSVKTATLDCEALSVVVASATSEGVVNRTVKQELTPSPGVPNQEQPLDSNCEPELQPVFSLPCDIAIRDQLISATPVSSTCLSAKRKTYARNQPRKSHSADERCTLFNSKLSRQAHSRKKMKDSGKAKQCLDEAIAKHASCVAKDARTGKLGARFLLDLWWSYGRKTLKWSESSIKFCLMLFLKSPGTYSYMQKCNMLSVPPIHVLKRYMGYATAGDAVPVLVQHRVSMEIRRFHLEGKLASITFEETPIRSSKSSRLACWLDAKSYGCPPNCRPSHLLCFSLQGLVVDCVIPVAFYLTKDPSSSLTYTYLLQVLDFVEKLGVQVLWIQGRTTVKSCCNTLRLLGGGILRSMVRHPSDPLRVIFVSCDPAEIVKDVRSRLVDGQRSLVNNGKCISLLPLMQLFAEQNDSGFETQDPIMRRQFCQTDKTKRSLNRFAKLLLHQSEEKLMQSSPLAKICDMQATTEFMELMKKWFQILSVFTRKIPCDSLRSSGSQHTHPLNSENIVWLVTTFVKYFETWQKSCRRKMEFLELRLYQALILTTAAAVQYISYLSKEHVEVLKHLIPNENVDKIVAVLRKLKNVSKVQIEIESESNKIITSDSEVVIAQNSAVTLSNFLPYNDGTNVSSLQDAPHFFSSTTLHESENFQLPIFQLAAPQNTISENGSKEKDCRVPSGGVMSINGKELLLKKDSSIYKVLEAGGQSPSSQKFLLNLCTDLQKSLKVNVTRLNLSRNAHLKSLKPRFYPKTVDPPVVGKNGGNCGDTVIEDNGPTKDQEDEMWSSEIFGDSSPKVLLRTLMYLNRKHFGICNEQEHLNLKLQQFSFIEVDGRLAIRFVSNSRNNSKDPIREVIQVADDFCPQRCHVLLLEKYLCLRPVDVEAFYLQPCRTAYGDRWFQKYPISSYYVCEFNNLICFQGRGVK